MKRIYLLTHLNGPDNKGGPPFGMPATTIEVEDAVADDAIARGFATAAKDETIAVGDPYAHLHIDAVTARTSANTLQVAADKAQADAKKAQDDADAAKKVADDADAAASKAENPVPAPAPVTPSPDARTAAQKALADFNASHPDPLSVADKATKDTLIASASA
jgi:hypothetical protein